MYTIMNYSNLRAIVVFTICVWRCEWAGALCTCTPLCMSLHNCAHFLHWFVHCQCTPLCVHFAQLCRVFAQFCASAEAGGGMRRFYTHLQRTSWRQFFPCTASNGWNICTFIGGDVTEARQPGWMGLQRRIFSVGANLPKHWKDGRWVITDQLARWWSAWKVLGLQFVITNGYKDLISFTVGANLPKHWNKF